jgi:NAD(P)-dependent dehydrogenase (short-subunit alcohol dehydrogenase family)
VKTILIIGNSDGIGLAVTNALMERGDRVVGISRSASPPSSTGVRHEVCDVTAPGFPELVERLSGEHGGFDACVYCAGIGSELVLPDVSNESRVFEVNLLGMVRTMQALLPDWIGRRAGHFIGLSSIADDIYILGAPSYSASKAGFSSYLVAMGLELRRSGVAVTNVRLGFVDTKMARASRKPMMMTVEAAARHVVACLDKRPLQLTVPKPIGLLVHLAHWVQSVRVWLS